GLHAPYLGGLQRRPLGRISVLVNVPRAYQPKHNRIALLDVRRSRNDRDLLARPILHSGKVQALGVRVLLQPRHAPGVDLLPLLTTRDTMLTLLPRQRQPPSQFFRRNVNIYILPQPRERYPNWHGSLRTAYCLLLISKSNKQ